MNTFVLFLIILCSVIILSLIAYICYNLIEIHKLEQRIKHKKDDDNNDAVDESYVESHHLLGGELDES